MLEAEKLVHVGKLSLSYIYYFTKKKENKPILKFFIITIEKKENS
ncbi:hypothetical protein B1no1_00480 [Thermolongibacillus altinsuensis]|nr:hypothetical protein B1no1_00480 [Thermolongibacillus altinsuensis]